MRFEALASLGLLACSCHAQSLSPGPPGYLPLPVNTTIPAAYNSTSSSSTTSSSSASSSSKSSSTSSSTAATGYASSNSSQPVQTSSTVVNPAYSSYASSSNSSQPVPSGTVSNPAYSSQPYHYNPSPVRPGTAPGHNSSRIFPTGTAPHRPVTVCAGQTLNVLQASLDWWYPRTVYNVVSTISLQFNKNDSQVGWTVLPATTSFNLDSALASPTCVGTQTWNTIFERGASISKRSGICGTASGRVRAGSWNAVLGSMVIKGVWMKCWNLMIE